MAPRGRPPKGALRLVEPELPDLIALWRRAAESPLGIVIASQRPNALAQRLYAARRMTGGSYTDLRVVEDEGKVWIVPRTLPSPSPTTNDGEPT